MTKYQQTVLVRRAIQKEIRNQNKKSEYIYRGVRYNKSKELPNYITDNPYYP